MYIVNFGIAKYFREILHDETVASEWHSITFEVVLECDIDIIISFLDNLSNKAQVRFWNSMF